eukprot:8822681-Pyramimonas_sp.AAC.1
MRYAFVKRAKGAQGGRKYVLIHSTRERESLRRRVTGRIVIGRNEKGFGDGNQNLGSLELNMFARNE